MLALRSVQGSLDVEAVAGTPHLAMSTTRDFGTRVAHYRLSRILCRINTRRIRIVVSISRAECDSSRRVSEAVHVHLGHLVPYNG